MSRFISEYLIRASETDDSQMHLDDMIEGFKGERYFEEDEVFSREELRTYGSVMLVEMGMIFKELYLQKERKTIGRGTDKDENKNHRNDIIICMSILLAKSKSAKTIAIEQNLVKKIIEICQENVSALHLADI